MTLTPRALRRQEHGSLAVVQQLARRVAFGRSRRGRGREQAPDATAEAALADLLWEPVAPTCGDRAVVLSAPVELGAMPWGALAGLRDRTFSLAPSAQAWLAAGDRDPTLGSVGAVAGPGLPGALAEVVGVRAAHGATSTGPEQPATAAAALDLFERSDLLHVAAHGRLRTDNPLFSSLQLADGDVTGYDLEHLERVPAVVVLSCCHAGSDASLAPGEAMGLATTLLRLGARSVIAPAGPIADAESADIMVALHASLAAGSSAAEALAACRSGPWDAASTLLAFGA